MICVSLEAKSQRKSKFYCMSKAIPIQNQMVLILFTCCAWYCIIWILMIQVYYPVQLVLCITIEANLDHEKKPELVLLYDF